MIKTAVISEDQNYRYRLDRAWGVGQIATFIMLNPSTADALDDDPTIHKCIGFAERWGLTGLAVINLFAFRATRPTDLLRAADPFGPRSEEYIAEALGSAAKIGGPVVCGWGVSGGDKARERGRHVLIACRRLNVAPKALRVTKDGSPGHPLYVPYSAQLSDYPPTRR